MTRVYVQSKENASNIVWVDGKVVTKGQLTTADVDKIRAQIAGK